MVEGFCISSDLLCVQAVQLGRVFTEDLVFDRSAAIAQLDFPALFFHHVIWNLKATHGFDLPLRRAVPHRISTPHHALRTHQVDQLSDEGGTEARVSHCGTGKARSDLGINVVDAVFLRNTSQVCRPLDIAILFKLRHFHVGFVGQPWTQSSMVDDKVHFGPVFGGFTNISNRCVFPSAGKSLFVVTWHQTFVDTNGVDTRLERFFIERIHEFFIVQTPCVFRRSEGVPNGVGLPRHWLEFSNGTVHFIHPIGIFGCDDGVTQHAHAASHLVDRTTGVLNRIVGEQPPVRVIKRRARQQRNGGITVKKNFLEVIVHFVTRQIGGNTANIGIDFGTLSPFGQTQQAFFLEVVANEVSLIIKNELTFVFGFAVACGIRVFDFCRIDIKYVAVNHVHGHEGGSHTRGRSQKFAASCVVTLGFFVSNFFDQELNLFLLFCLRHRVVFAIGDNLCRYWRTKSSLVSMQALVKFSFRHGNAKWTLFITHKSLPF